MAKPQTLNLNPVGDRCECSYFSKEENREGEIEPWCRLFQLYPECDGDIEHCDVHMFRPDKREGYR